MIFFTRIAFDEIQETLTKAACSRAALRRSPAWNLVNSKQAACPTFFLYHLGISDFFSCRAKKAHILLWTKEDRGRERKRQNDANELCFLLGPVRVHEGRGLSHKKSKKPRIHVRYPRKTPISFLFSRFYDL